MFARSGVTSKCFRETDMISSAELKQLMEFWENPVEAHIALALSRAWRTLRHYERMASQGDGGDGVSDAMEWTSTSTGTVVVRVDYLDKNPSKLIYSQKALRGSRGELSRIARERAALKRREDRVHRERFNRRFTQERE